jgi:predicted SprT family Zn-dependent metalloprotease
MENVKVKEELSVEFVLILPNERVQLDKTKIKSETETGKEENSKREDEFACETCDKEFTSKRSLMSHKETHKSKVECKVCNKSLTVLSFK